MRHFEILDQVETDPSSGILTLRAASAETPPRLSLRIEGDYITISASFGPMEIALRPRLQELSRALAHLTPIDGLHFTRQIGTAQSYIAVGLRIDQSLLLRPTIVADATGLMCLNLEVTPEARARLYNWLGIG